MKVIATADLHLGAGITAKMRSNRFLVFHRILNIVKEERVDILLISGDFLEQDRISTAEVKEIIRDLSELEAQVFISPGNHDPYTIMSKYAEFKWSENVKVFRDPETVVLEKLPVTVTGAGFKNIYERDSLFAKSAEMFDQTLQGLSRDRDFSETSIKDYLHLANFHGEVEANSLYNPISKFDLARSKFAYVALGHIHKGELELQRAGDTYYAQTGTAEPLDLGDTGVRGVYLLDFTEDNSLRSTQYISTAKTVYINLLLNFYNLNSYQFIIEQLKLEIAEQVRIYDANINSLSEGLNSKYNFKQDFIFNIRITGTISEDFHVDEFVLLNLLAENGIAHEKLDIDLGLNFDIEKISVENSLRGVYVRRILQEMDLVDESRKKVLQEALQLGLESFGNSIW